MEIRSLAGHPAPPGMLTDVAKLERAYDESAPEFDALNVRGLFGPSGHRGTSANDDGPPTEHRQARVRQARLGDLDARPGENVR
jgi:hypothetical protein